MDKSNQSSLPTRIYTGVVNIGGKELSCAVLNDGTRLLTAASVFKAFDRPRRGKRGVDQDRPNLPSFMDANNLKPFIDEVFQGGSGFEIQYITKSGNTTYTGYNAEILPAICEVYLRARDSGVLTENQKPLAIIADILMRSLAKVGIIALIDEATGYQVERDRDELQKILSKYISAELLPWAKRFPDEFYIQICRLKGWEYKGKPKSPYIGKLTNEIIYNYLPPGVLEELRVKNPRNPETKNRKNRHHQYLTPSTGIVHLDNQLQQSMALMKAADTWEEFERLLKKAMGEPYQMSLDEIFVNDI